MLVFGTAVGLIFFFHKPGEGEHGFDVLRVLFNDLAEAIRGLAVVAVTFSNRRSEFLDLEVAGGEGARLP